MTDNFNNEINTKFVKVTPPSLFVPRSGLKIFLAGSIGDGTALDWQTDISSYIEKTWTDEDITIYNPRRPGEFLPEMEPEHAAWTMSMITLADYILLHLTGDSGSPISTLELGMFIDDPRLFLSISDDYIKKEVVQYHYNVFGIGQIYDYPENCVNAMKAQWYKRKNL